MFCQGTGIFISVLGYLKTQKSQLQIPNDRELCVDVQLDREYFVGVVQPVPVNVYDYYEPGQSCHFLS